MKFVWILLIFCLQAFAEIDNSKNIESVFSDSTQIKDKWKIVMQLAKDTQVNENIFVQATKDKDCFVRNAGLIALKARNPNKALKAAEILLKDKALVVRSAALDIIKTYPQKINRNLLWKELSQSYNFRSGKSLWIRKDILNTLALKPLSSEKNEFLKLSTDSDQELSNQAKKILINL